ncbi:hypothetical protein P7K49_030958 [Saguinus oedipus]|uniref:Uncharacterized protein n=1 Tax=Saguinus oedipus TaxID=9490 RepID=A0ABQ9U4J6_SAGOE|nr:hypothetical protein P7K49_030958 [Saguinus oedipus]
MSLENASQGCCAPLPLQRPLIPTQDALLLILPPRCLDLGSSITSPLVVPLFPALLSNLVSLPSDRWLSAHPTDTRSPLRYVWPQLAEEHACRTLRSFEGHRPSKMSKGASEKQAEQKVCRAFQASKEAHGTLAAMPWVAVGSAYGSCICLGAQPITDPALWPVMGTSSVINSWMGCFPQAYPAFWAYPWVLNGGYLWMGYPPPAALVPSVWPYWRGISSFDPLVRSLYLDALAPNLFPVPMGFPPSYSLASPTLGGAISSHCPQVGCQTPASSAPMAAVGELSRGAPYLKRCQASPSEWASRFSIWAPLPHCSSELRPLPPSPIEDSQSDPGCPHSSSHRSPCRARRRLFEC